MDRVVDATGAGDAFVAAVLVHLSEACGWPTDEAAVREAVRRGAAAGALACSDFGAMRALPARESLERFVAVYGERNTGVSKTEGAISDGHVVGLGGGAWQGVGD